MIALIPIQDYGIAQDGLTITVTSANTPSSASRLWYRCTVAEYGPAAMQTNPCFSRRDLSSDYQ